MVGEVLCVEKAIVSHMLPEYMVFNYDVDVEFVFWQQELWSNKGWKIFLLKRYQAKGSSSATHKDQ